VAVICDLDGVVWLGAQPIAGAAEAVARLRAGGQRVLFVTNNSAVPLAAVEDKLGGMGVHARGDVLTSAMAAAGLVAPGSLVLAAAGPGVVEALEQRGARVVRERTEEVPDVVVVGLHFDFDYERLRVACEAIRRGARFVATNTDATYPTPDGLIPGGGALVAAVAAASGQAPEVAGKPHEPMAALVRATLGADGADMVMVGDRWDTDGLFARTLGCRFALVLSGVTRPGEEPTDPPPDLVAADLATLADGLLGAGGS
jgi:4-nitrophenyl phosphatase